IGSTATLYWCGSEPVADIFNRHGLKVGDKLYAKPVPADKPKYKAVTASDLPMESSREHLLSEAANRADYFFRQIDGSYSFPAPDGQVAQIIEMLLAAANMPADKTAARITEQDARGIIKEIFMEHGFTIKDGQTDLKPYVYDAALALLNKLN